MFYTLLQRPAFYNKNYFHVIGDSYLHMVAMIRRGKSFDLSVDLLKSV